jgi:hypothetical protein
MEKNVPGHKQSIKAGAARTAAQGARNYRFLRFLTLATAMMAPGRPDHSARATFPPGRAARGPREQPNASAITPSFEQCEPKSILLGAENATDKSFLIRCDPVTPHVLGDFKMMRGDRRSWGKVVHARTANAVAPVALSSLPIQSATDR